MSESSTRFPALTRVREYFEGLSARERTLLATLGITITLLGVLTGTYFIYDRIDSLEETRAQFEAIAGTLNGAGDVTGLVIQYQAFFTQNSTSPPSPLASP